MRPEPRNRFCGLLASAITIAALVGCNGSTGPAGANATASGNVDNASTLTSAQWIALNPQGQVTSVSLSGSQGRPVVNFKLTDSTGKGIVGLGGYTKFNSATDKIASFPNLTFTIAKLIPAGGLASNPTPNAQSKWVNYMVMTVPTVSGPASVPQGPGTESCQDTSANPQYGLVDHGDGTYTYTFYTDVTKVASAVTAYGKANSVDVSALDPTNLAFDANAPTRVVIEFFGNARGYGIGQHANTADGSNGSANAELQHPINIVYDFTPATGQAVSPSANSREIVTLANCDTCHTQLAYHGGHRVDPRNCAICHTDQRRYGFTEAPRNAQATGFTGSNTEMVNGTSEFDFDQLIHQLHMGSNLYMTGHDIDPDTASTYTAHTSSLTIAGEYAINFPQNTANCTACHTAVTSSTGSVLNPQAGNWATTPSRAACGGCHDNVNFISLTSNHTGGQQTDDSKCSGCHNSTDIGIYHTGLMSPVENATNVLGHNPSITSNWQATNPNNLPKDPLNAATGNNAATISYNIVSATVNASGNPVLQFQILANPNTTGSSAQPLVLNTFSGDVTLEALPAPYAAGPFISLAMGIPQDGITPTDFNYGHNESASWNLRQIWNQTATLANGLKLASAGVTLVPGTTATYQVVMTGYVVPTGTQLVGIGIGFGGVVQTNLTADPLLNLRPGGAPNFAWSKATTAANQGTGGVLLPGKTIWASATGTGLIARRAIIKDGACEACHGNLGSFTTNGNTNTVTGTQSTTGSATITNFHGGNYNNGDACIFCHYSTGNSTGYSYNAKTWVHALHASGMRSNPYIIQSNFPGIIYPGVLNNCEACHVTGSFDFSGSTNAAQIPGMLWDTAATQPTSGSGASKVEGVWPSSGVSPWVDKTINYGVTQTFAAPTPASATWYTTQPVGAQVYGTNGATLSGPNGYESSAVSSPITAACAACHDSSAAVSHMVGNGGQWYTQRKNVPLVGANGASAGLQTASASIVLKSTEQCLVCHGSGQVEDIAVVHANY